MGRERIAALIVVDTSALMAIYLGEPDARALGRLLFSADPALVAAPTALEFTMVASSRRSGQDSSIVRPEILLERPGVVIAPWTDQHLAIAREAFRRFGKGCGHPAQLNFGDCISYALAGVLDAPLLFKGSDFALTDVRSAV